MRKSNLKYIERVIGSFHKRQNRPVIFITYDGISFYHNARAYAEQEIYEAFPDGLIIIREIVGRDSPLLDNHVSADSNN